MNIYIRHLANRISANEYIGCEYIELNIRALRIAGSGYDKEINKENGYDSELKKNQMLARGV